MTGGTLGQPSFELLNSSIRLQLVSVMDEVMLHKGMNKSDYCLSLKSMFPLLYNANVTI